MANVVNYGNVLNSMNESIRIRNEQEALAEQAAIQYKLQKLEEIVSNKKNYVKNAKLGSFDNFAHNYLGVDTKRWKSVALDAEKNALEAELYGVNPSFPTYFTGEGLSPKIQKSLAKKGINTPERRLEYLRGGVSDYANTPFTTLINTVNTGLNNVVDRGIQSVSDAKTEYINRLLNSLNSR